MKKGNRSLYLCVPNEVAEIITKRANKEDVSVSEYLRNIVNNAIVSETIRTVGINSIKNDKVTKVRKPVSYRKLATSR